MVCRMSSGLKSAPDADMQQELSLRGQTGKDKAVLMIDGLRFFTILSRVIYRVICRIRHVE